MEQITQQQIDNWKKAHGDVFKINVDGHVCYVKSPDRKTLGYASSIGTKDPMKFNEVILKNCWLGGDETVMTNDALFLGAGQVLAEIIQIREASIEKL